MKTIINILGGTGSGKSTLGRELAGDGGVEYRGFFPVDGKDEKVVWSLFPSKFAVAGNIGSGSDVITSLLATSPLVKYLLSLKDVKTVIVNPIRTSRTWSVDFIGSLGARVIYVFIATSYEENVRRVQGRRASHGRDDMSDNTLRNIKAFHNRAAGVAAYAEQQMVKRRDVFLRLGDKDSVAASVKKVRAIL